MNRPDHEVAAKIVEQLERGVERLDTGTRERLAAARQAALSRYSERPEPVWGFAWALSAIGLRGSQHAPGTRYVAIAALVLVLIGFGYWQTMMPGNGNDISEVDVSLLTDELPINAYLDKGFDSWLKRASR